MEYTALLFEVQNGIAKITLNQPQAKNAINLDMAQDFMHAALCCNEDPEIRTVIITGGGNTFCPGGDVKSFVAAAEDLPRYLKETLAYLHAGLSCLMRMDTPLVVSVNGVAAGAGMSLSCAGDITVADESARFVSAYTQIGLTPDGSLTYCLSRIVGMKRALELVLTNRVLSAQEALDWGIVTRVVSDEDLLAETEAIAARMASGATKALGTAKRLLRGGWTETLETQMECEARAIADMGRTADAKEGFAAFLEKRPPNFKGN
ncbi:MAG: enoyl-CoA hydratase/isomerase family protein [Dehalococcoidia bacterium]|nr:enoyl-CoA hydratase/isomerase family protein [Dehalococcoidia bacterium]